MVLLFEERVVFPPLGGGGGSWGWVLGGFGDVTPVFLLPAERLSSAHATGVLLRKPPPPPPHCFLLSGSFTVSLEFFFPGKALVAALERSPG